MLLVTVSSVLLSICLIGEDFYFNCAFLRTESMYNMSMSNM